MRFNNLIMKFEYFLTAINEIKNAKFDFHGNIGTLTAFNSNSDFYWQILIQQNFNSDENYTYATIKFDLRIKDTQIYFDVIEIAFNSLDKYFEYAKEEFLRQISNYRIKGISQF